MQPPHQTITKVTEMNHTSQPNHRQLVSIAKASKYWSPEIQPETARREREEKEGGRDFWLQRIWKSTRIFKSRRSRLRGSKEAEGGGESLNLNSWEQRANVALRQRSQCGHERKQAEKGDSGCSRRRARSAKVRRVKPLRTPMLSG